MHYEAVESTHECSTSVAYELRLNTLKDTVYFDDFHSDTSRLTLAALKNGV